jgi:hypothetical protein
MRYTVTIPHKNEWHTVAWAKENCPSYISCTGYLKEDKDQGFIEYYFSDEKDASVFSLRWI